MTMNDQFSQASHEKLDIPDYIDQPEYVKNKSAGYTLMIVAWLIWACLFLPALTALFWWFQGSVAYEQLIIESKPESAISLIVLMFMILILVACLIVWASYNWFRFGQNEKRSAAPNVANSKLSESFDIGQHHLDELQQSYNITLYYGEAGQLYAYEVVDQTRISAANSRYVNLSTQNH